MRCCQVSVNCRHLIQLKQNNNKRNNNYCLSVGCSYNDCSMLLLRSFIYFLREHNGETCWTDFTLVGVRLSAKKAELTSISYFAGINCEIDRLSDCSPWDRRHENLRCIVCFAWWKLYSCNYSPNFCTITLSLLTSRYGQWGLYELEPNTLPANYIKLCYIWVCCSIVFHEESIYNQTWLS